MLNAKCLRERPLAFIVDDDFNTRLLMRETLEQAGFAVEEAENGAEAVSKFCSLMPDVVIMDVVMPEMDGFTACERLKAASGGDRIPILMMTGLDDVESINRAYEAGATDFITKPVNWAVLGHRLRYILRASSAFDRLRESEARNRAFVNAIPDMLFRVGRDGVCLDYAAAKGDGLIADAAGFVGKRLDEFSPGLAQRAMHYVHRTLESGEIQVFEYELSQNGTRRFLEGRVVVSGEDEVLTIVRDFTERKTAEERIHLLAYYDSLTGLPNRLFFKERLEHALNHARRHKKQLAVLFVDLDRFKRINDTLGHSVGDKLLKGFAEKLEWCIRDTDSVTRTPPAEFSGTISRLGGDEFIVLLTEIRNEIDVAKIAKRVLNELSQPFALDSYEVFVTASIGIAVYPADGTDCDTLLKNADTAMYHAKDQGRNNFQFYTESMNASAFERLILESSLRRALEKEEFRLYFQPQLDMARNVITGVEALIRWNHPELGVVSPGEFIPIAEEAGLIIPIGEWVLRTACRQIKSWAGAGMPPMTVAVNISSRQFRQQSLLSTVAEAVKELGPEAGLLKLELTESTIMQGVEETVDILREFKSMGLGVLIDDFGTGYSSLSYLKRFPLDALKIDRSFVKDVTHDPDDANITKAIIALSHSLNLRVIAEGVETKEQFEFLKENGCDEMQGYLFSKPLPADELEKFVSAFSWPAA